MLANAEEGGTNAVQELYVVNNTFVNNLGRGNFVRAQAPSRATLVNNIFVGAGSVLIGAGLVKNDLLVAGFGGAPNIQQPLFRDGEIIEEGTMTAVDADLVDIRRYDYRLRPGSQAIGRGIDPGAASGVSLLPAFQYRDPTEAVPVNRTGPVDLGAYLHER